MIHMSRNGNRIEMNVLGALAITLGLALSAPAQVKTEVPPVEPGAKPATVERIKVLGASLAGNLEGEDADRAVLVFLPPSYATAKSRRYPVVYALHGYSIGAEQWSKEIHVPQTIEGAFAKGAQEMIVVLPDSKTVYNGSMYSSSVTTGGSKAADPGLLRAANSRSTGIPTICSTSCSGVAPATSLDATVAPSLSTV